MLYSTKLRNNIKIYLFANPICREPCVLEYVPAEQKKQALEAEAPAQEREGSLT